MVTNNNNNKKKAQLHPSTTNPSWDFSESKGEYSVGSKENVSCKQKEHTERMKAPSSTLSENPTELY